MSYKFGLMWVYMNNGSIFIFKTEKVWIWIKQSILKNSPSCVSDVPVVSDRGQRCWGSQVEQKSCIERLSESAVKCVQVCECVRDAIEGQNATQPVYKQADSSRGRWRGRYVSSLIIMTGSKSVIRVEQNPRLFIESKPTFSSSFPADFFIRHCYNSLPAPFSLPVTVSRQTLSAQNLLKVLKSLRMVRIQLLLFHICHFCVALRQDELRVCCVWIQCDSTWICIQEGIQEYYKLQIFKASVTKGLCPSEYLHFLSPGVILICSPCSKL